MKACVDKTFVSEGHSITVKLLVSNLSKKPVNCIKFILSGGVDETPVNTVEDATRDATSSTNDPVFPLVKSTWQGDVQYMLPIVSPGFYKLRVQLFYNTRYNIEVPIALHVLSKQDMWHHNPLQVFGVPLDEVLKREGGVIPLAVARPLEALCRESCLTVEGIFRMSGDLTKILSVRDEMDSGKVRHIGYVVVFWFLKTEKNVIGSIVYKHAGRNWVSRRSFGRWSFEVVFTAATSSSVHRSFV